MEKGDKGSTMIRMGVSGWMFLLVPAYTGCPGSKAVKRSLLLVRARRRRKLISNKLYWHCCELVKLSELINYRRKKRVSLCVNSSLMTVNYQSLQHRLEQGAERKSQNITVAVTTHLFSGPFSRTTQVRCYQKGKTDLDFTERRDSEWQWHQLGYILQRWWHSLHWVYALLRTAPHHPVFYRPDALPAAQPTAS